MHMTVNGTGVGSGGMSTISFLVTPISQINSSINAAQNHISLDLTQFFASSRDLIIDYATGGASAITSIAIEVYNVGNNAFI